MFNNCGFDTLDKHGYKKFHVSPDTFVDFLLGRDVSAKSIDSKGAEHPILKEAALTFLGLDDQPSCKAVYSYWLRRRLEIIQILKYGSDVERKKEARLRYFLEITGLKLITREEILKGERSDNGAVDNGPVPEVRSIVSENKCSFPVSAPCKPKEVKPISKDSIFEIHLVNDDSFVFDDSEGEKEDLIENWWKKEGEFTITAAEWKSVCENGLKLSRKWTSLISQKFFTVNAACVIQFQGYHFNKQSRSNTPFLMIRAYCAHVSCKKFRLTMKCPPNANENSVVVVWGRGTEKHGEKKKTRQLKGWDRLHAKRILISEKAHLYREEKFKEADKYAISRGNLQDVKSLNVLRRARSEALKEDRLN